MKKINGNNIIDYKIEQMVSRIEDSMRSSVSDRDIKLAVDDALDHFNEASLIADALLMIEDNLSADVADDVANIVVLALNDRRQDDYLFDFVRVRSQDLRSRKRVDDSMTLIIRAARVAANADDKNSSAANRITRLLIQ